MNLVAAILILGASGSAERSMETDQRVSVIVARVAWGGVSDVASNSVSGLFDDIKHDGSVLRQVSSVSLSIDGTERTGLRSWGEAAWRVAGFVIADQGDAGIRNGGLAGSGRDYLGTGIIDYSYRLYVRGYAIRRSTRIEDGHVLLTTDAWWTELVPVGRSTRRVPIHVRITIDATEGDRTTVLAGTATGKADTRDFRCGFVRRIAERQAERALADGLAECLRGVERGGRGYYAGGAGLVDVLDGIKIGIRLIGRR